MVVVVVAVVVVAVVVVAGVVVVVAVVVVLVVFVGVTVVLVLFVGLAVVLVGEAVEVVVAQPFKIAATPITARVDFIILLFSFRGTGNEYI